MSLFRKFLLILPVSLIFAVTGWGQTAAFEGIVRNHLMAELGERPIGTIRRRDIQTLVSAWAQQQAPLKKKEFRERTTCRSSTMS